jgi:hypothetical protein
MAVNRETIEKIVDNISAKAALSHWEFFAHLYTYYYDYDKSLRSIQQVIPDDVAQWLDEHVGVRDKGVA